MLLQQDAERAFGQAGRGGRGDLLHGLEVHRLAGARLTPDTTGDNFAPLGGQSMDLLKLLRRERARFHNPSSLVLATIDSDVFLLSC